MSHLSRSPLVRGMYATSLTAIIAAFVAWTFAVLTGTPTNGALGAVLFGFGAVMALAGVGFQAAAQSLEQFEAEQYQYRQQQAASPEVTQEPGRPAFFRHLGHPQDGDDAD